MEALRQPLEDGRIAVTRMARRVEFPARFTLGTAAPVERWRPDQRARFEDKLERLESESS